jgi:flagellin-like protein
MKGISPIIASVLLIAITMSIAVVLAAYVTSYTREVTESIPTTCIGGAAYFAATPQLEGCTLQASIESQFVELSNFNVDCRNATTDIVLGTDIATSGLASLDAGDVGTVTATLPSQCCEPNDIEIRVSTNCFNVRTPWENPA